LILRVRTYLFIPHAQYQRRSVTFVYQQKGAINKILLGKLVCRLSGVNLDSQHAINF
jgi:hypothetical protein